MKHVNILAFGDFFRETVEPRRRQEERDSKMINQSSSSIANLPQESINRQFNIRYQVERLKNEANED